MCGIFSFFGDEKAVPIVFQGLKKLEYRGYDSWGLAFKKGRELKVIKKVGKIGLEKNIKELEEPDSKKASISVSHCRWATHGRVCLENAHPLLSNNGKIAVVHNGIVENYQELKEFLKKQGFTFNSETDTEVIPNLIELYMSKENNGFQQAVAATAQKLKGRYAFVALHADFNELIAVRQGSPLALGKNEEGIFIASDVPAFLDKTNQAVFLDDNELVAVKNKSFEVFALDSGMKKEKQFEKVEWKIEQAEKQGFDHFLLKEILEQKQSIWQAVEKNREKFPEVAQEINDSFGSFLVGCGTAGKVCLTGTYLFSKIADKHVNFCVGSEFPYYEHFLTEKTLMMPVSQSGETADTLEAISTAKKKRTKIISIINALGSSMERASDKVLFVNAGVEKAVASTKATTGQIAILTALAYACAGKLEEGLKLLKKTCQEVEAMLSEEFLKKIEELAGKIKSAENIYIIGRGLNYPVALEAAIKLQEVPYIHAEGFAGGELKHGPLALIEKNVPCIALCANDETKADILSNAMEVKSRGGMIIGLAPENNEIFDEWIKVPDVGNCSPIVNLIPVQLLAYYIAIARGLNPSYLRNLAKSVTVK